MISRVLTLISALALHEASGHATMSFPRTRNVVTPHSCPTCANGPSVCGSGNGGQWQANDAEASATNSAYTTPLTNLVAGGMIETEAYFTATHQGHAVLELCAVPGATITNDCFVRLERDPSDTRFSPYSPLAPGYIFMPDNNCAGTFTQSNPMRVRFKIPETAISDHAVLRWQWQTGNSCDSSPYNTRKSDVAEISTWTNVINGHTCNAALSGGWTSCGTDCPGKQCNMEQFRTCADVKISAGDPSTIITSGNAETEVPNGQADASGSDDSDSRPTEVTTKRPAATTPVGEVVDKGQLAECLRKIRGTAPQWDGYCQERCPEYAVAGSFGAAWCDAAGFTNLYACVAAHQAACQ